MLQAEERVFDRLLLLDLKSDGSSAEPQRIRILRTSRSERARNKERTHTSRNMQRRES